MSRLRHIMHGVASGYLLLAANTVYSLVSVPLALHYLHRKEFGLWAVVGGVAGYFALIDLGMSASVARLLIDYKDQKQLGAYGSLIKTGWLVLVVQGLLIFGVGYCAAPLLCGVAAIEPAMQHDFIQLIRWQMAVMGLGFCTRIFSHLLVAHQRNDLCNYAQLAGLILNLIFLWWFFHAGAGVYSLVWSGLLNLGGVVLACLLACYRLSLFPPFGAWGAVSWGLFKELFGYGKDVFVAALGTQLISASQSILVTRRLGLEAAAVWTVGTRSFTLICQAVWRIMLYSGPAFSEMIVRQERGLLRTRFRDILILSGSLSAFCAISFAACNSLFVSVWTRTSAHTPIVWPPLNDVLLGLWLMVLSLLNCHNNLVLNTKQIGFMGYCYLVEGFVFVGGAWVLSRWGGVPVIIACSVVCSILFTYAYGVYRTHRYFGSPVSEITGSWLAPMAKVLLLFGPWAVAVRIATSPLDEVGRLALNALGCGIVGGIVFLRYGMPAALRRELLERTLGRVNPAIKTLLRLERAQ